MNSHLFSLMVVLGLAVIAAGCATVEPEAPAPAAEMAPMLPPPIPPELNIVAFLDPELAEHVAVAKTDYRRTDANTLEVVAAFKNLSECAINLQARALYFSEDRVPQEDPQAWQPIYLPANGMGTFTARSFQPDSEYYYVEVTGLE